MNIVQFFRRQLREEKTKRRVERDQGGATHGALDGGVMIVRL